MPVKVATWNVNSLRVRLPHLVDWLAAHGPDVMCLQETKCDDATFPAAELAAAGYHSLSHGQKTYNGVAVLSRAEALRPCAAGSLDSPTSKAGCSPRTWTACGW